MIIESVWQSALIYTRSPSFVQRKFRLMHVNRQIIDF